MQIHALKESGKQRECLIKRVTKKLNPKSKKDCSCWDSFFKPESGGGTIRNTVLHRIFTEGGTKAQNQAFFDAPRVCAPKLARF